MRPERELNLKLIWAPALETAWPGTAPARSTRPRPAGGETQGCAVPERCRGPRRGACAGPAASPMAPADRVAYFTSVVEWRGSRPHNLRLIRFELREEIGEHSPTARRGAAAGQGVFDRVLVSARLLTYTAKGDKVAVFTCRKGNGPEGAGAGGAWGLLDARLEQRRAFRDRR